MQTPFALHHCIKAGIREKTMQVKYGLMALGVIGISVLLPSAAVHAKADQNPAHKKRIVVTVKAGDTLEGIAKRYKRTYVQLFNANKRIENPDLIDIGDKIRIPHKKEKLRNRFGSYQAGGETPYVSVTASSNSYSAATPSKTVVRASSAGNTYGWGTCTWYAKQRRPDLPNMLGNGGQWVANAAARGIATGYTPRAGAIAEMPGHVMYVESVHKNGTITISEMNYNGGVGVVHTRTIPSRGIAYIY